MNEHSIRAGQVCDRDARKAVRNFHASIVQPDTTLVVFFCSASYDLDALADEMQQVFTDTAVVGCTTAGEIGPAGYRDHSITGVSFSRKNCSAVTGILDHLQDFTLTSGQSLVQDLLKRLETLEPAAADNNTFAFLLIDGLSAREEIVSHVLQSSLGRMPLVGGSAGGGLNFTQPYVYHDGRFHRDSAALILMTTSLPFTLFRTQHFVATDERLVVTAADPERRMVMEINGLPAAEEYARIVGVAVEDLDPMRFANAPVVVLIDGSEYVRAICRAGPDGSLLFFCAIEEGLVLRVAHGHDLIGNLKESFLGIRKRIGPPQLVFGCDCILRNQEITQSGMQEEVEKVLLDNNVIGFSTYGEQYHGVHINQTLTGIAIGAPAGIT